MTNPQDLAVLRSEIGRDQIAQNIYKAFRIYKARYDREEIADQVGNDVTVGNDAPAAVNDVTVVNDTPAEPSVTPGPDRESPEVGQPKVLYGVQVLVSSKDMKDSDPFFAGYKPMKLPAGKLVKYVVGVSEKLQDVKKKYPAIQKKFPDSYIVKVQDGATSPVK